MTNVGINSPAGHIHPPNTPQTPLQTLLGRRLDHRIHTPGNQCNTREKSLTISSLKELGAEPSAGGPLLLPEKDGVANHDHMDR